MHTIRQIVVWSLLFFSLIVGIGQSHADQGDWLVRFGAANINPDSGSRGVVADDAIGVEDATSAFINGTYMLRDNVGIELLASTPFTHEITLDGSGTIAETDHLPPTLSLQYYFMQGQKIRPYVGLGVNWTTFFNEEVKGVISSISLDDSVGVAVQVGIDFDVNEQWFVNANIRKISIDTTAETDLGNIDVDIDPVVVSLGVGYRF